GSDKIIIFGQSMGTLPAIAQAARSPDRVVGLVVEGSFTETLPTWAFTLLGIAPDPIAFSRIPDELVSANNIVNVTIPKRFLHSRDDLTTPIGGARQLYELAPDPKSFFETFGIHLDAINRDPAYEPALVEFLDEVSGD
ncbi:MAG: alpha/beta hydrolase, partial [Phycisphaerales bacterium]|nr:alpha/beta hydrolase [Phycisphaerales bacterium]